MSSTRRYKVSGNFSAAKLAESIEMFLAGKGLESQVVTSDNGFLYVQARESSTLKSAFGLDKTAQIEISYTDDILTASVGSGDWLAKKAITGIIWHLIWPPMIFASIVGAASQSAFPDEIFGFIHRYLSSNGRV